MSLPPAPSPEIREQTLAYLAKTASKIEPVLNPKTPSFIIGGARRSGKSTLAKALAKELSVYHLRTDKVRQDLYRDMAQDDKRGVMRFAYKTLFEHFPKGLLIEGTAFTLYKRDLPAWGIGKNIPVFMIGNTGNEKSKQTAMLAFRAKNKCWTTKNYADDAMLDLASSITRESVKIKAHCDENGYRFFDINPERFERDLSAAKDEICATLRLAHS